MMMREESSDIGTGGRGWCKEAPLLKKKNTKETRMSFTVIMELSPFFLSKLSIFLRY